MAFKLFQPKLYSALLCGSAIALFMGLLAETSHARIKLATLPDKENVKIRFDHPYLVFAEEDREIALQQGQNTIDFSWAGTTIDKSSIVFRPLDPDTPIKILSTSYPPGENALTWQVFSPDARSEQFRVSYLMGSIDRKTSYQVVVSADEKSATLKHYFKITNHSGEDFDDASFVMASGKNFQRSLEYGEAKRMLARRYEEVQLQKEYVFDQWRDSKAVSTDYVLQNASGVGLGEEAFEYGKVRIYQSDGKGGTAFIGEDWGEFTPVGENMRLFIGTAQDIKVERKLFSYEKKNIRGNVYDTDEWLHYEIKNFKQEPVELTVVERINGEWEFQNDTNLAGTPVQIAEQETNEEVRFRVQIPPTTDPEKPTILKFHYQRKNVW